MVPILLAYASLVQLDLIPTSREAVIVMIKLLVLGRLLLVRVLRVYVVLVQSALFLLPSLPA